MGNVKQPVRVALIGCGRVAEVHAQSLTQLAETELAAVVDVKKERAKDFQRRYGVPRAYTDYREALAQKEIDAVQICTPHYLHAPIAIAAAEAGKHILTEKPMAISVADANAMIAAARTHGVTLGVIFQNRYNDASQAVKKAIVEGKLGRLRGTRAMITWDRSDDYYRESDWKGTWDKEGGGVLIDQAIHTIDLMQWLVGSEITAIAGTYATRAHKYIQVDDVAEAYLQFANGVTGCLYANCFYPYDAPIFLEIYGEEGVAHIIGDRAVLRYGENVTVQVEQARNTVVEGLRYWGFSHLRQIRDFYRDLLAGRKPFLDGEAGKVAMGIVLAIYASARTGQTIDFPRFLA